jgi:hypothetical protein
LFADFDTSVNRIIPEPFLLSAQVEGSVRRHVPDFLLPSNGGPTVVDLKPSPTPLSEVVLAALHRPACLLKRENRRPVQPPIPGLAEGGTGRV